MDFIWEFGAVNESETRFIDWNQLDLVNIFGCEMTGQREKVAVAIDKDKGSQAALKWAVDNLLGKGKSVNLVHVKLKANESTKEVFLPFRCFCTRKNVRTPLTFFFSVLVLL